MIERYVFLNGTKILYGTLTECVIRWFDRIDFKKLEFVGFDIMFNVKEGLDYDSLGNYVKSKKYMKHSYRCCDVGDTFDKNKTVKGIIGSNDGNGIIAFELKDKNSYDVFIDKVIALIGNNINKDSYCIIEFPGYYIKY